MLWALAAKAQRKAGKDTILFTLSIQDGPTATDSGRATLITFTSDLSSIFLETINMDSVPYNLKVADISVELTIDSNCVARVGAVTGSDKHEYLVRKTREYFNKARIVFITGEGIETANCGSASTKFQLPVKYRFL